MSRILLTGGRAPVALELARHFAATGDAIFVADSAPHFLTRSSRFVTRAHSLPSPRESPRAFAAALETLVRTERITRIVPTCEEVFYLAHFKDRLAPLAELFCPDFELLRVLHDKWRFGALARELGAEVPDTWLLTSPSDLFSPPLQTTSLVYKPVFSRFAVHTLIRPSPARVARVHPTPEHPWIAQRFVVGRELCTYSVARGGRLTAHTTYEPTWRAGRGAGFYFAPVACAAIEAFTCQLISSTGYTGQLGLDAILTPEGRLSILECNPRATSGVHLFDEPEQLAAAFDGSSADVARPRGDHPAMLAPAMTVIGVPQAVRSRRLRLLLADWRRARDVIWSRQDPLPAFYLFVGLCAYLDLARRQGISPRAASTRDIEWDGDPIP
jgi:hypothetical protein